MEQESQKSLFLETPCRWQHNLEEEKNDAEDIDLTKIAPTSVERNSFQPLRVLAKAIVCQMNESAFIR